ncbi:hypothetical protein SEA_AZULA_36 [Gordonia phage Azula]|uniref:Uncharacterized protein n=1 Tax=Gordonia phage Azula TaxID=2762397 RepID=A0A7G8LKS5_9CAUD|nr:hypothetical protein KNV23_gp36 [Gordonia phage Azula]QGJ97409.1 hypothetical protein SEA_GAMBINO_37 [Gordonia phage Gambino]QNJ57847.1 hypothetical protein SEA_AZULA_36 [Gordonia phage Azula]
MQHFSRFRCGEHEQSRGTQADDDGEDVVDHAAWTQPAPGRFPAMMAG